MKLKNPFRKQGETLTQSPIDDVKENTSDDRSASGGGDENTERGNWSHPIEFLLTCVSYAVGLGNIWRFPYLCMRNGGGAFLIPYFTFMFVIGMPLFYLELALGQFSSLSVISVWNLSPLFKGVGIATMMVTAVVCVYYNIIIGWVLYYLFHSFQWTLPWATCDNAWNTPNCIVRTSARLNDTNTTSLYDVISPNSSMIDGNLTGNESSFINGTLIGQIKRSTAAEEFWHFNVLEMSAGIEHLDGIQWKLFGALALSCLLVFLCIIKGIKSVGKAVYVTASVPYIFLTILLIRGLTLPGAIDGIYYYVTPEWHRLSEFRVWVEACLQIFYSLGPGWGSLITMASYNRFHKRMHIDALLVPLINCGTSFYAGFVIFSIIGFMAKDAGLTVKEVVSSGPGLAFIAYPEALTKLPMPPLWAVLFFIMLLNIGMGSQFSMVQTVISSFLDQCPGILKYFKRKWIFTGFICLVMCLLSMIFVTKAGIYYFQVVDWYASALAVSLIAVLECVVVSLIYGISRFRYDVECMIGRKPSLVLSAMWMCVTPLLILLVLSVSLSDFPEPYYGDYTYPAWAVTMGWCLASASVVPIPVVALRSLMTSRGSLRQRIRQQTRPAEDWGPALPKHRQNYKYSNKGQLQSISDRYETEKLTVEESL